MKSSLKIVKFAGIIFKWIIVIWLNDKIPVSTVGRQLPPMPLPPTKMADAPSGRNKQSRLMFSLICAWIYKRLSKQSWGSWFQTPSRSLWRHFNGQQWPADYMLHCMPVDPDSKVYGAYMRPTWGPQGPGGAHKDQSHNYGRHQAACREPAGSYDKTTRTAICFEHKTQYLLIRAPYTRIVVFCHIRNIPPMISQSQIICNTPTFYIAAIFVKCCYAAGSWLL